jgi:predicted MFS family arabinose efflux permease
MVFPYRCHSVITLPDHPPAQGVAGQGSDMSAYLSEIRTHWRPLLAAFIGMSCGMSMVGTITSTLVPSILAETRWSQAEFARIGSLAIFMALVFPFIGRLTDMIGVRMTALIGLSSLPIIYLAYGRMDGDIGTYKLIFIVQSLICVTTTATVYSRLAVQYVEKARGLALAIVVSGPALAGMLVGPLLNTYVEANGWRSSFEVVAIFTALFGLIAFLLIPKGPGPVHADVLKRSASGTFLERTVRDYTLIFRTPAFWFLFTAMVLCNLPLTLLLVQLKSLVLANGITAESAGLMLFAVPFGQLIGRFVAGFAIDRYNAYVVAFFTMALPSLGLFVIASPYDTEIIIAAAVFCVGFAFGAEGDVVAFLVARHFGVAIYSSVMGLLTAVMSISTASGAALLGWTMEASNGGFDLFLVITGVAVFTGATLLLLLGRFGRARSEALPS